MKSELLENFLVNLKPVYKGKKNKDNIQIEINKSATSLNEVDIYIKEFNSDIPTTYMYLFNKSVLDKEFEIRYLCYIKADIEFVETDEKKALKLLFDSYQDKLIDTLELFELI